MKAGWQIKCLGDVTKVGAGNPAPQGAQLFKNGIYPFFRTSDAGRIRLGDIYESSDYLNEDGIKGLRLFPAGTILFPKSGASTFLNHRVMLGVDGYVSSHLATIVADNAKIHERFLFYFLTTISAQDLVQDHAYPSLNLPIISAIEVPLPPLPEQQRIASILDEAFEGIATAIANAEKNLANAPELFESYLQSVFSNKGEGWEEKALKEVCELKSGTTISPSLERSEGDVLYTKVGDMNLPENMVEINTSSRFVNSNEIKMNQIIPEGAIIFPKRGGAIATNKKRRIVKPTIVDLNTMALIPSKKINKDYLFHWFQLFDLNSISNGANVPQINNYSFDKVYIAYPTSLMAQEIIVKKLDELSAETKKLEAIYQQKLNALTELKKSILNQAFSGQLQ